jgi:hypothetical protein
MKMSNYYNSLAREQMMKAQTALEKADEYLAIASRDNGGFDINFRKSIAQLKKKLYAELERLANVMADKDLSGESEA